MFIVLLISLYTTRVVLKVLGVEDYGIYNVVAGFVAMFSFLNTSMSNGIQRFYNYKLGREGEDSLISVYNCALRIQILLAIAVLALVEGIGIWYINNIMVVPSERLFAANIIFQLSVISMIIVIMQAPFVGATMAMERMDFFAIVSIVDALLKLGFIFVLVKVPYDKLIIWGSIGLLIVLIDFLFYYIYCKKEFRFIKYENKFSRVEFKAMLSFSGWNIFGSFSNMARDQGVNMIMNLFFGPIVNAARGVAMQINSALSGFTNSILTPVRPQVIQSFAKGEGSRYIQLTYSISKISVCFLYMMALPLCIEIDYVLKLWLGDNVPEHTNSFVIIILLTNAVLVLMGALATLVHASGEMKKYQVVGSTVKIISVPAAYFLLKLDFSPEWALVMVLLFDVIGLFIGMFIIKGIMKFSIRDYLKNVIFPMIIPVMTSFFIALFIHNIMQPGIARLLVVTLLSCCSLAITFYIIGFNYSEKKLVNQLGGKFISIFKKQ